MATKETTNKAAASKQTEPTTTENVQSGAQNQQTTTECPHFKPKDGLTAEAMEEGSLYNLIKDAEISLNHLWQGMRGRGYFVPNPIYLIAQAFQVKGNWREGEPLYFEANILPEDFAAYTGRNQQEDETDQNQTPVQAEKGWDGVKNVTPAHGRNRSIMKSKGKAKRTP